MIVQVRSAIRFTVPLHHRPAAGLNLQGGVVEYSLPAPP